MHLKHPIRALALVGLIAVPAHAQYSISWSTLDGGGGACTSATYEVRGTAGQPDAASAMTGGSYTLTGGFWTAANDCYANCDNSTTPPTLNVQDFACFLNLFASGHPYANCDGSTTNPVLNVQDFSCFLNKFAAGCP